MEKNYVFTDKEKEEALKEWMILYLEHPWLFGPSFIKRAFAVWGYELAALAIVYGIVIAIVVIASTFNGY